MTYYESKKRYDQKYKKEKAKSISIFMIKKDYDATLLPYIKKKKPDQSVSGFIKDCIQYIITHDITP